MTNSEARAPSRAAAIDIGTNSVLLLLAESAAQGYRAVKQACTITRLGRGVDASRTLSPAGIEATLNALRAYRATLDSFPPCPLRMVGTSALRDATNASHFIGAATALMKAPLEVIEGRREAELAIGGVKTSLELAEGSIVFDVGGGSTELIRVGEAGRVDTRASLDIGSVRLTERFALSDPPQHSELRAVREQIREVLAAQLGSAFGSQASRLVGVAGTVTTLVTTRDQITDYDAERVDGAKLTLAEVEGELQRYLAHTLETRKMLPGLAAARADVIIAGAHIVLAVAQHFGASELYVSDRGVRWGLVAELLASKGR